MQGKIYVIESGSDACGKQTQQELLYEKLKKQNDKTIRITFPNYKSDSSFAVKMYLNGELSKKPSDIDAYATSTFFAIDRYLTFKKDVFEKYNDGYTIIADRYTTSNILYQGAKMKEDEREKFIKWLYDLEYNIYGLPRPDAVFYLDVPFEISTKLLKKRRRYNYVKDIHEEDINYLKEVYDISKKIAIELDWNIIDCSKYEKLLTKEEINQKIMEHIK